MGAWEGVLVPQEYQEAGQRYLRKYREMDGRLDLSIRADKGLIKPSPSMVEEVCQYLSDPRAVFFVVGDSVRKDLAPCRSLDITTIWAKYGQRTDEKDQATLDSITPWTKEEFALHYDAEFEPDYTIGSFEELRDILPIPYQQRLL
jgi:FMN phosphatase YigB (HAD superfamily)